MTRSFVKQPLDPDAVEILCRSALAGPSAGNTASAEVLSLEANDIERYWDTTLSPDRRASFPWPGLLVAPLLLVVYIRPQAYLDRYGEPDKARTGLGESQGAWQVPYWWVDGGAAVQNVLLSAESLSLGACFFGQFEHEVPVRTMFGVPEDRRAVGTIAVGHRDDRAERKSLSSQRQGVPRSERVHHGSWTRNGAT